MDDAELWAGFERHSIPEPEWTHRSHVRIAFAFLQRLRSQLDLDIDEAHVRMRAGIIRMNERHGLVETSARGYAETLTRVWLCLVADAVRRNPDVLTRDSRALLMAAPDLLDSQLPLRHYTRERLMSKAARAIFIAPDLAALPELG
jgi:hypothetical protein